MNSMVFRLVSAFIIALVLTILPLPSFLSGFRPPWVLLLSLYLVFYNPQALHLSMLFILGLVLDVLLSTVMGEHAFALLLVTWLASSKQRRFSHFPIGHQIILIGLLCFSYQFIIFCIDGSFGFAASFLPTVLSALLSMMLWPWIRLLGDATFIFRIKSNAF